MRLFTIIERLFLLIIILCLPNCGRIVDWGNCVFNQGCELDKSIIKRTHCFVRSLSVYDQFTTAALFDALWVNSEVQAAYNTVHCRRTGCTFSGQDCFASCLQETNGISFIVLTSYESPLFSTGCPWSIFLQMNGCEYAPSELRAIDLPCEFQLFFGNNYNQFKVAYLVTFDVQLSPAQTIKLVFRSATRQACMEWQNNTKGDCPCDK